MHTTDDLTFLKAQEAELEYLVKAAPPGAVIERTQYERELKEVREALLQRVSTETPADLPWLKAQAAELERLIRIAPPSAVIAKFQYEEQLDDVRDSISILENQRVLESPKTHRQNGIEFQRGYSTPYFVTNNDEMVCELKNAMILICEDEISNMRALIPLLEQVSKAGIPLLIIAGDIVGEALATLVVNQLRGIIKVCAVKAPGYGERRKATLEDILVFTGGKVVLNDRDLTLESVTLSDLGSAKNVLVSRDATLILEGAGSQKAIDDRVAQIRNELASTVPGYEREKLEERLCRFLDGVDVPINRSKDIDGLTPKLEEPIEEDPKVQERMVFDFGAK